MEDILKELKLVFHEKYDEKATKSYFSPGRVNLIGEHIDYNGGLCFSMCDYTRDLRSGPETRG